MENGTHVDCVNVDMQMYVVKELSSRWTMSAYDYICSSPDIICNGFKKAGITSAIQNGIEAIDPLVSATFQEFDDDPFVLDDNTDC